MKYKLLIFFILITYNLLGQSHNITIFPQLLNTNSPLPLTSLNEDNNLNLIAYYPSKKNIINIYTLKDRIFMKNKESSCSLLSSDGFIWKINFKDQNLISNFYKKKWSK